MDASQWNELNANAFAGLSMLIEIAAWLIGSLSLGCLVACVSGMIWQGLADLRSQVAARLTTSPASPITGIAHHRLRSQPR